MCLCNPTHLPLAVADTGPPPQACMDRPLPALLMQLPQERPP